jgi:DNA-binding response OmpR family regulator
MNEKILIVDDEKKMVRMLKTCLEQEGYVTLEAYDGEAALDLWRREQPDLVVLDVLMPRLDGLEFCRRVRERAATPIIILSAKSEETDKLVGLELGADDYMTKPFSLRELVARIRALLRRFKAQADGEERCIVQGPLMIDRDEHRVEVDGRGVPLTATEFDILVALASHPGRVFSRRQIIDEVQGDYFEGYERSVDAHVGNIRKKILEQARDWSIIETVYGVGYRFQPERQA